MFPVDTNRETLYFSLQALKESLLNVVVKVRRITTRNLSLVRNAEKKIVCVRLLTHVPWARLRCGQGIPQVERAIISKIENTAGSLHLLVRGAVEVKGALMVVAHRTACVARV